MARIYRLLLATLSLISTNICIAYHADEETQKQCKKELDRMLLEINLNSIDNTQDYLAKYQPMINKYFQLGHDTCAHALLNKIPLPRDNAYQFEIIRKLSLIELADGPLRLIGSKQIGEGHEKRYFSFFHVAVNSPLVKAKKPLYFTVGERNKKDIPYFDVSELRFKAESGAEIFVTQRIVDLSKKLNKKINKWFNTRYVDYSGL